MIALIEMVAYYILYVWVGNFSVQSTYQYTALALYVL